jgi:hypothetical protein
MLPIRDCYLLIVFNGMQHNVEELQHSVGTSASTDTPQLIQPYQLVRAMKRSVDDFFVPANKYCGFPIKQDPV